MLLACLIHAFMLLKQSHTVAPIMDKSNLSDFMPLGKQSNQIHNAQTKS